MESKQQVETARKPIRCKAAVCRNPGEALVIEEIEVDPPQAFEVRIKILCTSLCHTDVTFWKLNVGPVAVFPRIFGHEAVGVVESVGENVEEVKKGDRVLPVFHPDCGDCRDCKSPKSNCCSAFPLSHRIGMPRDGTSRFRDSNGEVLHHFLYVSSFAEYTVVDIAAQKSTSSSALIESETEIEASSPKSKRQKLANATASSEEANPDGQQKVSHITVERNRRKQMNEHLSILRSLMPCFYVKRGDQASIIGGVVDYINELQQVLQSLEAKKQRKLYREVLSPRLVSSPRPSPLSPRKPPLSPRLNLPISPRTPQPSSPYKPRLQQQGYLSPTSMPTSLDPSPSSSSSTSSINDTVNELFANSKSSIADVEVKFSGPNVLLKTVSSRIPGQAMKIISALENLSLEILHLSITTIDENMLNSFTIKIGIECKLSAEELAHQIQQTFC